MSVSQAIFEKIIRAGVMAPSGENCQPWRFVVHAPDIRVHNIPERDQSLYSWGQRASYFAHGALLENISIAARALGYDSEIRLWPEPDNEILVALVTLREFSPQEEPLADQIPQRATNRKIYANDPLTEEQRNTILAAGRQFSGVELVLRESMEDRHAIARAAAVNEEVLFSNEEMHQFFFDHVNWTKKEDAWKSIGFYVKTLELPGPAKIMFRLIRYWPVALLLARAGIPEKIAEENAKVYASGAAVGAVIVPNNRRENFVLAGRVIQRVWLTVTKLGLSFQPLAGVPFLMLGVHNGQTGSLSPARVNRIRWAYGEFERIFSSRGKVIPMAFRVGDGGQPTARASRLSPEMRFE